MVPWAGVGRGLSLLLDQHSNLISAGTVSDDYKGWSLNYKKKYIKSFEKVLAKAWTCSTTFVFMAMLKSHCL